MGSYGLSCDKRLSVDIVTADGKLLKAGAGENPDRF
jgi:FAD/FMN-containing dehydrogenase